jgi:hypothetical protein
MSPRPPPADFHGQPLFLPGITTHPGKLPSRGISKGSLAFTHRRFPSPVATGWNSSPRAFPRAPHPAVTSCARQGGDRSRTLTGSHVFGITRTSNQRTHSTRATSCRSSHRHECVSAAARTGIARVRGWCLQRVSRACPRPGRGGVRRLPAAADGRRVPAAPGASALAASGPGSRPPWLRYSFLSHHRAPATCCARLTGLIAIFRGQGRPG